MYRLHVICESKLYSILMVFDAISWIYLWVEIRVNFSSEVKFNNKVWMEIETRKLLTTRQLAPLDGIFLVIENISWTN